MPRIPGGGAGSPPQLPRLVIQPGSSAPQEEAAWASAGRTGWKKGSQVTDPVQQLIALRNLSGKEVRQIIKELPTDMPSSYQEVHEALNRKFLHKRNINYECYSFNLVSQEMDEPMWEFILRLKRLADTALLTCSQRKMIFACGSLKDANPSPCTDAS
ncbi:hypothetical protein NDU88_005147 [Pleurodeles waltl]|uniref:Uncharacterized protein n=1 Tax=Pleurodeles waltl TaxID=8319 RepID=A0AAV7UI23_PLEWA|nr:hypothetical protein NDU88_005147 [Pleurodeles waltl]